MIGLQKFHRRVVSIKRWSAIYSQLTRIMQEQGRSLRIIMKRPQPTPIARKQTSDITHSSQNSQESYEDLVDRRDQMLKFPFETHINPQNFRNNFSQYAPMVTDWLADVVETTLSVTFRHILAQALTISEGKAFAAKNILLNIKQLCEKLSIEDGVRLGSDFMEFLDEALAEIVTEVIRKYPQTNAKRASKRVLKFIKKISNKQKNQYDFLLNHGVQIKYRISGDYSSQIMTVINKVINLPMEEVTEDQTVMESYKSFCRQLYFNATQTIELNNNHHNYSLPHQVSRIIEETLKDVSQQDSIRGTNKMAEEQAHVKLQSKKYRQIAQGIIDSDGSTTPELIAFEKAKVKNMAIGQKVPTQVKQFSQKEIDSGHFRLYHSAILRVLTKWSGELYNKLQRADEYIKERIHRFKTDNNALRFCSVEEKIYLFDQAVKEKELIDDYLSVLNSEHKKFQQTFTKEKVQGKYIKRFVNVGVYAAKLEQIVAQYTFRYLNRLIHSVLSVPLAAADEIFSNYKYIEHKEEQAHKARQDLKAVNLVTLKVGDLVRSKIACHQNEFINILGILYKIEEIDRGFLEIVKIKNRMHTKNNDILINLFFRGKTLCELQLSITRQENKKEKLYSEFNHFIYELKRSQFGIMSQMASIITQNDPMINNFTFNQCQPPATRHLSLSSRFHHQPEPTCARRFDRKVSKSLDYDEQSIEKPFICPRCRQLRVVWNSDFYHRTGVLQNYCNSCLEESLYNAPQQHPQLIKGLFNTYFTPQVIDNITKSLTLWDPQQHLTSIKKSRDLETKILRQGFCIEKGLKLPKVNFFKSFFNKNHQCVILSTTKNGELDNFSKLGMKKSKRRFEFMNQLNEYLFFCLPTPQLKKVYECPQDYIADDSKQADFRATWALKTANIEEKQYISYIYSSFEKYHTTLYLNNYQHIMDYLKTHLEGKKKRQSNFRNSAIPVMNLLMEDSSMHQIYGIDLFTNLRQLNFSGNHLEDIHELAKASQLDVVNLSNNALVSVAPLKSLRTLKQLNISDNKIVSLEGVDKLPALSILDCSVNNLESVNLNALAQLEEVNIKNNYLTKMEGFSKLKRLRILNVSLNRLQEIDGLEELRKLEELNLTHNYITKYCCFMSQQRLKKLKMAQNKIKQISKIDAPLVQFDLSQNKIDKIGYLQNLVELQMLQLSRNKIKGNVQGLSSLTKLKSLYLNSNLIENIDHLANLTSLQVLKLSDNPINSLLQSAEEQAAQQRQQFKAIAKLKKLKQLSLANSRITLSHMFELHRIQDLNLSSNKITSIQKLIYQKALVNLNLSNNHITQIYDLRFLTSLNVLTLSQNRITSIKGLNELKDIKMLQLDNNKITKVQGLRHLGKLQELDLSCNSIQKIENLEGLLNLEILILKLNDIDKIEGLSKLSSLRFLDLQANRIKKIEGLQRQEELTWLILSVNEIEQLEGLEHLRRLQNLVIEHTHISQIKNLEELKQLIVLILSYNQISKIEGLSTLSELETLQLEGNSIRKIQNLQQLHKLANIDLAFNYITDIEGVSELDSLEKLNLMSNDIKEIRKELQENVSTWIELNLADNPVSNMDDFIEHRKQLKLGYTLVTEVVDANKIQEEQGSQSHESTPRIHFPPRKKSLLELPQALARKLSPSKKQTENIKQKCTKEEGKEKSRFCFLMEDRPNWIRDFSLKFNRFL